MASLEKRVDKLDEQMQHVLGVLDRVTANQEELDKAMVTLVDAQIKTQEQFRDTDRRLRETDQRLRETNDLLQQTIHENRATRLDAEARAREIDARIDKLVSGIGEFIRQSGPRPN